MNPLGAWLSAMTLAALLAHPAAMAQQSSAPDGAAAPPHVRRGDEVEARYRGFRARLERDFEALGSRLRTEAPVLSSKLKAAMPEPVPYGYQILPKLIADLPASTKTPRATSTLYSWRRTDAMIDGALKRLDALEARLDEVSVLAPSARRDVWARIVDDYIALARDHKLINSHIQYNRLWQKEIARDRSGYDYMTGLHDAVLERETILDSIRSGDQNPALPAREQELLRQIRQRADVLVVPGFARIEHPTPHRWIVRVPVYTDIDDPSFVDAFRRAVENAWRVQDAGDEFQAALDIRPVSVARLYPDGDPPARGAHIDLAKHAARFPADGAVLTTGANTTHVLGRAINVGPHDIAPNVLAHEFGHILGFVDGYFRGYRDRGAEGYDVLEVLTDPADIMSAPGRGRVQRRHFERILAQKQSGTTPGAGPATHGR